MLSPRQNTMAGNEMLRTVWLDQSWTCCKRQAAGCHARDNGVRERRAVPAQNGQMFPAAAAAPQPHLGRVALLRIPKHLNDETLFHQDCDKAT